ncbi:MAG: hypothetical protein KA314_09175 [Chloroflexi bacterium]|nr:hypothetical protein [Chloroflexota bacterium]
MRGIMASGYLRLKAAELLKEKGMNLHQASQMGRFSYPTMHRYINYPATVQAMHTRSIVGFLVDALGMTPEEIHNMKLGELFEVVLEDEGKSGE